MNARATRRPHSTRAYRRPVTTRKTPGGGGGGPGCSPFTRFGCLAWLLVIGAVIVVAEIASKSPQATQ